MALSRSDSHLIAGEREQLQAFLDDNRDEIVELLEGVTDEQARRRLVPSQTSLAAIVKHCVFVEKVWFQVSLAGKTRVELGLPDDADESWILSDSDTIESLIAEYRQACAVSQLVADDYELDDLALHNRRGPLTLRWIYAHMIEELARHAGHGDIVKELILNDEEGSG